MEAAAVVEIGLTRAEFWDLTPRQFQAFMDRHVDREIRHDRRIALLAVMYRNAHRGDGEQVFTLDDFAPLRQTANAEPPWTGPAFLKPCPECKVPKWQGHRPDCKIGQRQFENAAGRAKQETEQALDMIAAHGKTWLEPKT